MDNFLQTMLGLGVLIGGCAYAYGQWKDRRNGSKFDTIKLFKEQIDAMELKINSQAGEIKTLSKEVHDLKSEIAEKDKKLGELLTVLQGRDPVMQNTLKAFSEYMLVAKPIIEGLSKDVFPIIKRLEKYLDKQSY